MRPTSERQRRRNNALALLLIVCCISAAPKGICDNTINNNIRDVRQIRDLTSQSNPSGGDDFEGLDDILTAALTESDDENVNLKAEPMENQTLTSGDRATLRCRVKGIGSSNMVYTWYKNRVALRDDERIKMRNRTWGSRLVISDVYTSDSGLYQCEASNGLRRVKTEAFLLVTFHKLPEGQGPKIIHSMYQGKCEKYSGFACKEFFSRGTVYVDTFQVQQTLEDMITQALTAIANQPRIPQKCQIYAKEAFCYFLFPPCVHDRFDRPLKPATPLRLCREDCELLKYDVCGNAFYPQDHDDSPFSVIAQIKNTADCSKLPPTTSLRSNCTKIGLPSVVNGKHKCYNKTGVDYRGTLSVTAGSEICAPWPQKMLLAHPELSGGHNFCRNPGGSRDEPWCYVDREHTTAESCQVPICNFHKDDTPDLIMILIPAVSVPLLLGCLVVVFCVACRKKKKGEQHTKGSPMESKQLSVKKTKVPELSSNVVHVIGELGDGKFGKVFKAQVLSNLHYCPSDPVAVKTLNVGAPPNQVQEFQREMETFSELQHPNVSSLKAVVVQPSLRCMIFEYTSSVDLHEYLVLHSPQADFAKPPSSASSHASTNIDHSDFIRMAIQIAAGMEYLSSHNFIHRDLATRNILVTGNMELKISNLGVVRDSYLSCYYRSPQGGQMLPIRWMAPESLQNWKFSDKSAVWSFGVLLWETFSYGLQPYCGYSNHEVLDMISRRQLLTCPDQCPAKIYSLMHECWSSATSNRPQFKDIHAKLVAWEGTNTTRMTSQLAQGIHRQLNSLQQGPQQYPAHQGTMIDHPPVHDDMHRLHPQYNVSPNAGFLHPSPPGAPHTSPASRLYHSPGATTNSSAPSSHNANVYQQQHPGGYAPHNLPPPPHQDMRVYHPQQHHFHPGSHHSGTHSRSSESAASSEYNQHPPVRVPQLASHPEEVDPPPYGYLQQGRTSRPALGSHRSQDQVDGSGRNYSNDGTMEMSEEQQLIVKQARPNSGMRGDGRMPLAVYKGEGESEEPSSPGGRVRPTLAPKPNYYHEDPENPDSRLSRRPGVPGVNRDRGMSPSRLSEEQRSRNASSGGKAISCDSGLPCEEQDFDSEGADSHRPLISPTNSTSPSRPEIKSSPLAT